MNMPLHRPREKGSAPNSTLVATAVVLTLGVGVASYVSGGDTSPSPAPTDTVVAAPVPTSPTTSPTVTPTTKPTPKSSPTNTPKPTPEQPTAGDPVRPGIPTGIEIPDLGVDADIVVTRVVNGAFQVPENIQTIGWDEGTVKPGAKHGTALMAGHLDDAYGNDGALHDLLTLDQGDTLFVETGEGDITYQVSSVRNYNKTGLPAEIVARDGKHQIALVTCGGPLVRGADGLNHYRDNIVVWASPVR